MRGNSHLVIHQRQSTKTVHWLIFLKGWFWLWNILINTAYHFHINKGRLQNRLLFVGRISSPDSISDSPILNMAAKALIDRLAAQTQCEIFHLICLECECESLMWVLGRRHVPEELLPCRPARELASGSSPFSDTRLAGWPPDGTAVKRGHSPPLSCSWRTNRQHTSSTLWRPTLFLPLNTSSHLRRGR